MVSPQVVIVPDHFMRKIEMMAANLDVLGRFVILRQRVLLESSDLRIRCRRFEEGVCLKRYPERRGLWDVHGAL